MALSKERKTDGEEVREVDKPGVTQVLRTKLWVTEKIVI